MKKEQYKRKWIPAFAGMTLVISFLFFSCGGGGKKPGSEIESGETLSPQDIEGVVMGDWVIKREASDAEKLNPIVTNDNTAEGVYLYIYDALNDYDYEKFELLPKIGSLAEVSDDHLSYTYKLRKDAKFSDGHSLTGNDVIFTMKALKNPFADDAALRNYYEKLKKVELVNGDPYTIRFVMSEPYWRAIYTNGEMAIVPKHILDPDGLTDKYDWNELTDMKIAEKNPNIRKFADFLNSQEVSREPKYVVGSGPYMLEKWETGQSITLKRNPDYWDKNAIGPYVDKIVFRIIQDPSASVVAAKNKEVDVMYVTNPSDFYKGFENAGDFDLIRVTPSEPQYVYLGWNMNNPLFKDKRVRLALSYLVDRNSIIEKIFYSQARKIQSPVYYKQVKFLNTDLPEIPYDPEKARQLLTEAGWKDSNGDGVLDNIIDGKKVDFKFTFLVNSGNQPRKQTLLIVSEALKRVGIVADLQELEWSVYLDKTKKHEFDATMAGWALSVLPPDEYQIFHSSQSKGEGSNYISYNNPESDKLLEEYREEFDEAKRIDIIKRWQKLVYDDQVYTFLWTPKSRYVYNNRYKNTRWYAKRNSPIFSEWWVPKSLQKYTPTQN